MDQKEVLDTIKQKLKNHLMQVPEILFAYIFGSYARMSFDENSDIDIGIYTDDSEVDIERYLTLKREIIELVGREVDLALMNGASSVLKQQIIQEGILLFVKDENALSNFKVDSLFEFEDTNYIRSYAHKKMIERLENEVTEHG